MFMVDADRKATISLGGVCSLKCKHCYTLTKAFKSQLPRDFGEIISFLTTNIDAYDLICVSGDTDPFIDAELGVALLERIEANFPQKHLMFTTRLVLNFALKRRLECLIRKYVDSERLIFPCISLVTLDFPNGIEEEGLIPSGGDRLEWANELSGSGAPVIIALRPTFPFSLVGQEKVEAIAQSLSPRIAAVLGEVLLLDKEGQILRRLKANPQIKGLTEGKMTFINQDKIWNKLFLANEVDVHRQIFSKKRIPFFMRSMTAVELVEQKWDRLVGGYVELVDSDFLETRNIYP